MKMAALYNIIKLKNVNACVIISQKDYYLQTSI